MVPQVHEVGVAESFGIRRDARRWLTTLARCAPAVDDAPDPWTQIVSSASTYHGAVGDPATRTLYRWRAWEDRLLEETVLSLLMVGLHVKPVQGDGL
jgi:hypothetical protein